MKVIIGITGSSGVIFAREFLKRCDADKYLIVSKWGKYILKEELGISHEELNCYVKRQFVDDDLSAPISSGTNSFDACVIIPCSTSTVGKIASGIGDTLITRVAQVALKERFKLILCIRETPLSTAILEQCHKLSQQGVIIMPISAPMYFNPTSLEEYINAFVDKLLSVLGLGNVKGWRAEELE